MNKSKVAIVKCENYQIENVQVAVDTALTLLGGVEALLPVPKKTLLKPNFLTAEPPEKCATTHPAVFEAVARAVMPYCSGLRYGDSPAFTSMENVAHKSGVGAAATKLTVLPADFSHGQTIPFKEGRQQKQFYLADGVLQAEQLISISKLKTHAFTRLTGALKNQFGCIPGPSKAEFHALLPELEDFSQMIIDLNACVNPALYIMDGIWAMEGNGPKNGKPKFVGLILASTDGVALDATVCRLLGVSPQATPVLRLGEETGIGTWREENIQIVGCNLEEVKISDFDVQKLPPPLWQYLSRHFRRPFIPRPMLNKNLCNGCGVCYEICPVKPKAINKNSQGKPQFDYNRCIRCFCCQETCPQGALAVHTPIIRRVIKI